MSIIFGTGRSRISVAWKLAKLIKFRLVLTNVSDADPVAQVLPKTKYFEPWIAQQNSQIQFKYTVTIASRWLLLVTLFLVSKFSKLYQLLHIVVSIDEWKYNQTGMNNFQKNTTTQSCDIHVTSKKHKWWRKTTKANAMQTQRQKVSCAE